MFVAVKISVLSKSEVLVSDNYPPVKNMRSYTCHVTNTPQLRVKSTGAVIRNLLSLIQPLTTALASHRHGAILFHPSLETHGISLFTKPLTNIGGVLYRAVHIEYWIMVLLRRSKSTDSRW